MIFRALQPKLQSLPMDRQRDSQAGDGFGQRKINECACCRWLSFRRDCRNMGLLPVLFGGDDQAERIIRTFECEFISARDVEEW